VERRRRQPDRAILNTDQRIAGFPVEQVDPAGLASAREAAPHLSVNLGIEQDDRRRKIVVPDIVSHRLEVPAVLPGRRLDGDDGRAVEVIARTHSAVEIRTGVAG
jgi:hypothetical protein